MELQLRRIEMKNYPGRGDIMWLLFETGKIDKPIACLTDFQMQRFVESYDEQVEADKGEDK